MKLNNLGEMLFLWIIFELEGQKGSRNEERILFLDTSWSLGLSLNP